MFTTLITTLPFLLASLTSALPHINPRDIDYVSTVVQHHNLHRSNHSAPSLNYHYGLADTAQKIAASCVFAHNTEMDGGGYGQNIAAGVPWQNISEVITGLWYNSEVQAFADQYGKESPDMSGFEDFGHFSQIVWKASGYVGCYTEHCPDGIKNSDGTVDQGLMDFTVCNYQNTGNVGGAWADNVGRPLGQPTAQWNYQQQQQQSGGQQQQSGGQQQQSGGQQH